MRTKLEFFYRKVVCVLGFSAGHVGTTTLSSPHAYERSEAVAFKFEYVPPPLGVLGIKKWLATRPSPDAVRDYVALHYGPWPRRSGGLL